MRGRKPLPTALKVLHGNPGHRPLNEDEPQPNVAIPECPAHLDDQAKAEWHRITPELFDLGLLSEVDAMSLAAYCQAYSRWAAAEAVIAAEGLTFMTEKGMVRARPEISIAKESMRLVREFASEFGLTPSSRSRLHVERSQDGEGSVTNFARKRG